MQPDEIYQHPAAQASLGKLIQENEAQRGQIEMWKGLAAGYRQEALDARGYALMAEERAAALEARLQEVQA